jgi:glycosyltransferase involved in cell wall biosynthesis
MQEVKDPLTLVRAFLVLLGAVPGGRDRLRLVLVGDGPLRAAAQRLLESAGAAELAWLPGARDDVPEIFRALDIFVLPSIAEGISNTILEGMASGLPVVATRVGGNPELVTEGVTGTLVPPSDPVAMAQALRYYIERPDLIRTHGTAGRARIEREFSLDGMVQRYLAVYDTLIATHVRNSRER